MRNVLVATVILVLFAWTGLAEAPGWRDAQGSARPDTDWQKSKDGFGGMLLATSDPDWKEKWETSPTTVPNFQKIDAVRRGEKIFVLTFYTNPGLDNRKNADVTCDISNDRPDGSSAAHQSDIVCVHGEFKGDPMNVYLAPAVVEFVGEPKDLAGKWTVRVLLKDNVRHIQLPLKVTFDLK